MASTNVEYYEKQKELQSTINTSEQERLKLDDQLKAYFKSDTRLTKMKAVRLQNYWKKICQDEKRSHQRKEELMQEFARIDTHMTSMKTRTDKLRLLKDQYEAYVERNYPDWKNLLQARISGLPPEAATLMPEAEVTTTDRIDEKVKLQMDQIKKIKPTSDILNIRDVTLLHQQQKTYPSANVQQQQQDQQSYQPQHQQSYQPYQQQSYEPQQQQQQLPLVVSQSNGTSKTAFAKAATQVVYQSSSAGKPVEVEEEGEMVAQVDGGAAVSESINTQSDTQGDASEEVVLPLPVQNVSIQKKISATHVVKSGMEPEEDDVSDIGFDRDIQPEERVILRQRSVSGGDHSKGDSVSVSNKTFQRGNSLQSSKRWSEYGCVKPELTLDGLLALLKVIQDDFHQHFTTDGYYRSYRPDSDVRLEIIQKANSGSALDLFDLNLVSMVVLEQLILVVRSLSDGCLVSDAILMEDTMLTQDSIKQRLSSDGQSLWNGLFQHFSLLLHHKVMEAKEMAAIFVPCIVEDGSLKQDKAYQLIVRLLVAMNGEDTDDGSSLVASPVHQPVSLETFDGKVPPLKFGSLLEKPLTDDESTSFFSTAPKEKMPLNQTDAYKNMLSGTRNKRQTAATVDDDDDTDDDVEKQFASVLSARTPRSAQIKTPTSASSTSIANFDHKSKPPQIEDDSDTGSPSRMSSPVYVPTAIQPRSTMNSTGSQRVAGVKIGSDFDSESDVDGMMAGRQRKDSEQDDFDFYG